MTRTFKAGDSVQWTSSAQGSTTKKRGRVVAVIPAGRHSAETVRAEIESRRSTHRSNFGFGQGRDHESYLIEVQQGSTGKAKPVLYWPLVSKLSKA